MEHPTQAGPRAKGIVAMVYRIDTTRMIETEVQCVALGQIDKALAEIRDGGLDQAETVHQVRKRCKKIRGLLRLVRDSFSDPDLYSTENAYFRDAARSISAVRDAHVLIETFDKLMAASISNVNRGPFESIRRALVDHRDQLVEQTGDLPEKLNAFFAKMTDARRRVAFWRIGTSGSEAALPGLKRTYRRARKAMGEAYDAPSPERFHEWRKRVKYHWYHCRLLRDLWRPVMKARIGELDDLATLLGDYHDLDVLRARVEGLADRDATGPLDEMIGQRQQAIRQEAHPTGKRVFAEKPKHLIRRLQCYWQA